LVKDFIIFGSKARGDAKPDSDLDVLVVIREGDWRLKDALALPGYDLAIGTDVVPSILICTIDEWHRLKDRRSAFRDAVERDGVSIR
jgi:predicted nucleotidyltransferase